MPELPEVETIRRDLAAEVTGRRLERVFLYEPLVVRRPDPGRFVSELPGKRITGADRIAKYLLIRLSGGWTWVVHLMLEGQFLYQKADEPPGSDTKLAVQLDNGYQLRLRDVVGLARTYLLRDGELEPELKFDALGPEPISPEFTYACFLGRLHGRRGMLKPLLLDQKILAGLGNVYVDEALFRARLHPQRKVNTLTDDELHRLYDATVCVLREGIAHRGTSAPRALYRDLWGRKGHHQDYLAVFRRQGKPCACGGKVEQLRVGGRATFICPSCQVLT